VYGIFGAPIEHSLSPLIHNIAFKALEMNCVYLPFHVEPDNLAAAVGAIRGLGMGGVNVTIPYKEAVLPYLDRVEGDALVTGSVNTIVNQDGFLSGYSTDGEGLLLSLEKEAGFHPQGKKVVLIGAGGASRAVAFTLLREGIAALTIVNRTLKRAKALAEIIRERAGFKAYCLDNGDPALKDLATQADLVINATSVGMAPRTEEKPLYPLIESKGDCLVCDLIYRPLETAFLQEAKQHGLRTLNGLGMLLYQGILAFKLWTGLQPPEKPMRLVLEGFMEKSCETSLRNSIDDEKQEKMDGPRNKQEDV